MWSFVYSPPNIIRMIKLRGMRWAGHVAIMGKKEEGVEDLRRKSRRKETTRKTKTYVG
jgi:hypothetical protein